MPASPFSLYAHVTQSHPGCPRQQCRLQAVSQDLSFGTSPQYCRKQTSCVVTSGTYDTQTDVDSRLLKRDTF